MQRTDTDSTGSVSWSEPSYSGNPTTYTRDMTDHRRAVRLASEIAPWTCPNCGNDWEGVTRRGTIRRGCPDPVCAGQLRGNRATHSRPIIAASIVQAVLSEYRPGVAGCGARSIAARYGISHATVLRIAHKHGRK